ncbi:MAG: metalloregulator ArsR/SmtB family transcription factor [Streptococcaceae bacterium]|jgi:ArsR family transcriptional regulator|nr:metalloregulator ArsR/SmtB family transcription factor [Streptococcaceae bacterium]
MNYEQLSTQLKAMSEPNRMKIIDLLSCGELCACDVLEHFEFSQPTLSHHMKVLANAQIVDVTKKGQSHFYTLNQEFVASFTNSMQQLFSTNQDNCICRSQSCLHNGGNQNEKTRVI